MSAFIVSDRHITALVQFAITGHLGTYLQNVGPMQVYRRHDHLCEHVLTIMDESASEAGQILLNENYRSVNYYYDEHEEPRTYTYQRDYSLRLKPVDILKACACYDHQACETADYHESKAAAIIEAIRHRAIVLLPGYDDSPGWGL